ATVRYTTIDGEIVAEKRDGVRRTYVPDPLGSTVALLDSSQVRTDTFTYWPYGEERSRTGTTGTPFQFVGTAGPYRDSMSRAYVRARHPDLRSARWASPGPPGSLLRARSALPGCGLLRWASQSTSRSGTAAFAMAAIPGRTRRQYDAPGRDWPRLEATPTSTQATIRPRVST